MTSMKKSGYLRSFPEASRIGFFAPGGIQHADWA
jgi:hypothetical protein